MLIGLAPEFTLAELDAQHVPSQCERRIDAVGLGRSDGRSTIASDGTF